MSVYSKGQLVLQIKYTPHPSQLKFHTSPARFRILACGRRWGKTISGANEFLKCMFQRPNEAVGFAVAPTFWHTQKQWKEFFRYCPLELITDVHRGERKVDLMGKREVWFRSCDNPDSLRSEGIDVLWMDEYGQIKEDAWTMALRPALMDKKGIGIFTGTPKGRKWGFQLWTRGQDAAQTDYKSWAYPSWDNPIIDPKEIEDFARDMPERAYKQEILAEFIDDVGAVFRNIDSCIKGSYEEPDKFKAYYMGVDLAKHHDFTVLCVLDQEGHVCAFERFNQLDWVFQQRRIVNLATKYHARVLIDSTGLGDPVFDNLKRKGLKINGYKFTNASKADLIENLSIQFDNRDISFPDEPVLVNELKMFGYTTSPGGTVHYGAPSNYFDDCVIGLALAVWMVKARRRYGARFVNR